MTYRVGNHQPRNLYRGDQYIGVCFDPADTALIVDVMEGRTDTPDVDHTRGAAEALAHVRRQLDAWCELNPQYAWQVGYATVHGMLRVAAADLGVDEQEAPTAFGAPVCEHGYQLSARGAEIGIPVHMATGKLCGAPEQTRIADSEAGQ